MESFNPFSGVPPENMSGEKEPEKENPPKAEKAPDVVSVEKPEEESVLRRVEREYREAAEALKEQAAVEREKEKIEEKEEVVELLYDEAAIQLGGIKDFGAKKKVQEKEGVIEKTILANREEILKARAEKGGAGPEQPFDVAQGKPENPPEPPDRTEINELTRLLKTVREGRRDLAEGEFGLKKTGESLTLSQYYKPSYTGELKKIKEKKSAKFEETKKFYNESQKQLIEHLLKKAEKRWGEGKNPEKMKKFYENLVFKGFVGKEIDRLQKAKEDAMEPKEKGRLRKLSEAAMRQYTKLPKTARWGIAAGLGTAVALGTGAVALPAALGYAGVRYGRAALGSLSAVGIKGICDMAKGKWLKTHGKEAREKKIKENLMKEVANFSDREKSIELAIQAKDKRNEELAKLKRREKQWKIGTMAAMIGGGAGISFMAGSWDSFGAKPSGSFIKEPEAVPMGPRVSEAFIDKVHPGDSIWKISERNLEIQGYFRGLNQAQKDYLTDWVKDRVVEDKAKFGLADVADIERGLPPGHKFDITEVFKNKREALLHEVASAKKLSASEMEHIMNNRRINTEWLENNPGKPLTTAQVAENLGGKRLQILMEPKPSAGAVVETLAEKRAEVIGAAEEAGAGVSKAEAGITAEEYLRGLNQEQREIIDAQWEEYSKLPPLDDEALRKLEDYYEAKEDWTMGLFYEQQAQYFEDIFDILAPTKLRMGEYLAIRNVTVGKFLEEAAKNSPDYWPKLPHDGIYSAMELKRQIKLADFIRGTQPSALGKLLSVEEYLKNFIK